MNRILPILVSLCVVALACQSPTPVPDSEPTQRPPEKTSPGTEATAPHEPAEQDSPTLTYHFKDGFTRAYLPLTSPICQKNQSAQALYEIVALWRFDATAGQWTPLDVAPDVRYRIGCNAMLDLINILGFDLDPGTYAIAAEVNGELERNVFYNSEESCNDVDMGAAPEGQVPLCIVGESSAEARFVPDPAELEP